MVKCRGKGQDRCEPDPLQRNIHVRLLIDWRAMGLHESDRGVMFLPSRVCRMSTRPDGLGRVTELPGRGGAL